jgi:membrane-associated protease RseP (regulator of RpoE activity)
MSDLRPPEPADWAPPTPHRAAERRHGAELMAGGAVHDTDDDDLVGGWRGALGVLGVVAAIGVLGVFSAWWLVFAVGLLVSIFLHEVGHFVTARLTGMKATQFFIGFGPRLWSFRRGETEYGVRALPLGAFVRIVGMNMMDEVDPADEERAYRAKSFPRRLLVISAGSLMHMVLAIVILSGVFVTAGQSLLSDGVRVVAVGEAMPAANGGISADDIILAVDGRPVSAEEGLSPIIRSYAPGDTVAVTVERAGASVEIPVTLGSMAAVDGDADTAFMGVSSQPVVQTVRRPVWSAPGHALGAIVDQIGASVTGVVRVLNPTNILAHLAGTSDDPMSRPTTLVGITAVSDDVGEVAGLAGVLELLAYLNVFVGVFNMFPLLPLDGGHAVIAMYERVREGRTRRRYHADVARLMPLTVAVVMLLALLFMSGLYLDIVRPIG